MDAPVAMPEPASVPRVSAALLAPLARSACACPDLLLEQWQTTCLSVQGQRCAFRFVDPNQAVPAEIEQFLSNPLTKALPAATGGIFLSATHIVHGFR